jgi:peptidoglycan/LPS O-acetylase OafA/YrhL
MKVQPSKTERIHSLDSLRAIMMLLGLVIHSAITYGTYPYGDSWIMKSPNVTSLSNDFVVIFIHAFRMQIFFLVAGFFGAMLFYERQPLNMIKNRVSRVVYPFLIFLFILSPIIVFGFKNSELTINSSEKYDALFAKFSNLSFLIPEYTAHLWFLYYLIFITAFSVLLALLFKKLGKANSFVKNTFEWVIKKPIIRLLFFSGLTAILFMIMGIVSVKTTSWLIPEPTVFFYYLSFYLVGWVLYKSKHLLDSFKKLDFVSTLLAIALFSFQFFNRGLFNFEQTILINSVIVWLFIFGITGLFIRFASNHSSRMRYVSDSSYWVYLIHLPLTVVIPSLIIDWPFPATVKFLIVLITTGIICYVSYHYLVRGTFIGNFLNGRKYTRRLSDIKQAEESARLKPVLDK